MRKTTATAAFAVAAAGVAVLGAASPAMAQNSGVWAGPVSLANIDASSAAHWQICGQNVLTTSYNQNCDNRDHIGPGPQSGVNAGDVSAANVDASSAAHWQICGQNVLTQSFWQNCDNTDHISDNGNGNPDKGADQGDY
ncbi:hypothetical protein [Glycomyces niveus]|jgi:hypothetical protein|uniref:Uncharacterized protein n=1 Tax=Glycomyces niveus TaxID=2820287 RepID=A0ABS3UAJ0_9ACTN|nr:hypothetical protein [Glycomyces sp. NEAU-S30]MBO3735256.1 hypothetical protein [Glycomyces sp. NEAU-S30]